MVFERPLCVALDGFTLHAAMRAGGLDEPGREALLKYILRPAVAQERGLLLAATIYLLLGVVGALVYAARIATADEDDAGDAPGVEAEPVALASPDVPPQFPDARF